ncbi:MAG TPA: phosphotransferase family protein [Solirubrobacterales bacterium]|nr:phosphotransferase family protein [Solirubrobacterales bacterium]
MSAAARADAALELMRAAGAAGSAARVESLVQMEGGWSRHTYALDLLDPERGSAPRRYIVRVRPQDSVLDTDLGQEFRIFAALAEEPIPVPAVHGYEPSEDTPFGGPFFVMDRLPGDAVNVWRGRDRELLERNWAGSRSIAEDFVADLAAIHAVDLGRLDGVLARDYRATVEHWRGIYEDVRLVRDPVVEEAYAWLLDHEPEPIAPTLVHGDYRIGNCLVDDGRLSAVLDWELASIGDRRFDFGYMSLDYSAGRFVAPGSPLLGAVAEEEWFDRRYEALSGMAIDRSVANLYAVLGALMLFSIMGTGIHLYARGETPDIRTAWSRFVFPGLRRDIATLIGW